MVFNDLLKMMVERNASDLFITVGMAPSLKVDGVIKPVTEAVLTPEQARDVVMSVMNAHQRSEFERTLECNFAIGVAGLGRFRVNVFQQRNSIGMVLRRIQTDIPKLEDLGLPPILQDISMTKRGLVIFVGGTGTGKSTSLAAMIGYRNQNSSGHIISIEDPIEYVHRHQGCIVTQREVGVDTESFEIALKNTLRQAPDVILIGEIRDRETMSHAIAFAETGHLCLSTLHANSANQALDRIINFFPDDRRDQLLMDLSLNLKAVIAQRLLPRADGKGRCAAIEIMLNTPLMSDLLLKGAVHDIKALMTRSTESGMQTFDQALYDLYEKGDITYDDAVRYADSANDLRLMVKLHDEQKMKKIGSTLEGVSLVDPSKY